MFVFLWVNDTGAYCYEFTWPGKRAAKAAASAATTKTLRPCREESVDFDTTENLYIEGDIVTIIAPDGRKIGLGRSAYSNTEATALVGKHDVKPIVHYDYLIVNELTS